ncbi:MAG: hypothetical protein ACLSAM_03765 [Alistipes onderdonkii]
MQLTLANYRNQMGTGQVNAARLLNAVSGNGKQVSFRTSTSRWARR